VKLIGRPEAPTKRRGRTLSSRACGAEPLTVPETAFQAMIEKQAHSSQNLLTPFSALM
jgi:hypothetical protein